MRHLAPTEHGLPIQIYVFSRDQVWSNYEAIQARYLRPHPGDRAGVRPARLPEPVGGRRAGTAGHHQRRIAAPARPIARNVVCAIWAICAI